ncbi:MAG: SGNH/GDSL hydrolase family protein, partial [Aureliella sp.]
KQPLTIGCSGDSIAAGGDASGLNSVEPLQPAFPQLVEQQLKFSYDAPVELKNRAVGGWSIQNGLDDLDALLAEKPHLIIVAYGMNDVGRRDPKWFHDRMQDFIQRVHMADSNIEILMVTPMLGNVQWVHTPRDMFAAYRDQISEFVGPGVALADVGAVWQELLLRKNDLDLTGNGLNHPNDYGHRLYAQTILALLVE